MVVDVQPLSASFRVIEVPDPIVPDEELSQAIDSIWKSESAAAFPRLHEGQIFNLTGYADGIFEGCFVPYRRWVAQRKDPRLAPKLALRPLAVCAMARCSNSFLFGRRSEQVLQDPGVWELAPAGGLSAESRNVEGLVDPTLQILLELDEELGIKPDQVDHIEAIAVIDDREEGVFEIAYEIELVDAVMEQGRGSREYSEVTFVPERELAEFLRLVSRVCPSSLALLEYGAGIE